MKYIAASIAALFATPATAQLLNPPVVPVVDTAKIDAAIAAANAAATKAEVNALAATIPKPASSVPPTEMLGGTIGTAGTYRPADAAAVRITRAGIVTTSASTGDWSINWTMPLATIPVVLPIPVNTTTANAQPVVCNVATRTMTGATGRCWLARTLPATLVSLTALVTYDLFGTPASGIQVQILAIPPTQ